MNCVLSRDDRSILNTTRSVDCSVCMRPWRCSALLVPLPSLKFVCECILIDGSGVYKSEYKYAEGHLNSFPSARASVQAEDCARPYTTVANRRSRSALQ